jgi:hypothetical protein
LGLLVTIALEVTFFRAHNTVPSACAVYKTILKIVFREGLQHRQEFCLDHFICVEMAVYSIGKTDKWGFGSKIPWWKRKCETVCCRYARPISFVAKVRVEVFVHLHAVAAKRQ